MKDGPVSQGSLPVGWAAVQKTLEDAGFLTAKGYAGLNGAYWGDSRTLAEDTSDYRYEEVLRVTFKAIRKMRIAALKSLYDEAGDPLRPSGEDGVAYLKAAIENALDTMTATRPPELAAYRVEIPAGQDIANNGLDVLPTLIGIPIIREIRLHTKYVYAGGGYDPRLEDYPIYAGLACMAGFPAEAAAIPAAGALGASVASAGAERVNTGPTRALGASLLSLGGAPLHNETWTGEWDERRWNDYVGFAKLTTITR